MSMDRREFITLAAGGAAAGVLAAHASRARAESPRTPRFKAVAFDAFVLLDFRSVTAKADEVYPGKGAELAAEWRLRQFQYTWLRCVAQRYADFWKVTEDALVFATRKLQLDLDDEKRGKLMNTFGELKPWPDVPEALVALRQSGLRLAFLSNFTPRMLQANIVGCGWEEVFEFALSTHQVKSYKPDPRAYQLGIDALQLKKEEILFAAFGGWDAAGAKLFGYPTFWVNRADTPVEELGAKPDATGSTLTDLVAFVA
jgi:2-haloacid dehalogenase